MRLEKLRPGMKVETSQGVGTVRRVGGTFPPSVRVNIVGPLPRGEVNFQPRDVIRVLSEYGAIAGTQCQACEVHDDHERCTRSTTVGTQGFCGCACPQASVHREAALKRREAP